jgi:cell division inhibitor SepF
MNKIFSQFQDFLGLSQPVESEYEDEKEGDESQLYHSETPELTPEQDRRHHRQVREHFAVAPEPRVGATRNNVVGLPRAINTVAEVIVIEPRSYEEMPQVIQSLRERKSVVLNLTMMDPEQAQRAVDFVAGGTYAIDGRQQRVGERVFLFTPTCVQVTAQSSLIHPLSVTPTPVLHSGQG